MDETFMAIRGQRQKKNTTKKEETVDRQDFKERRNQQEREKGCVSKRAEEQYCRTGE